MTTATILLVTYLTQAPTCRTASAQVENVIHSKARELKGARSAARAGPASWCSVSSAVRCSPADCPAIPARLGGPCLSIRAVPVLRREAEPKAAELLRGQRPGTRVKVSENTTAAG